MRQSTTFPSVKAALEYAELTGQITYVDVREAARSFTGDLGPLSDAELWMVKQLRRREKYDAWAKDPNRKATYESKGHNLKVMARK